MMKRREFIAGLGSAAGWPLAARAQQATAPVIGFLRSTAANDSAYLLAAFHKGLGENDYVEGQNLKIEYRWGEDRHDRLPALAADLVRRQVTVIAAAGNEAVAAARAATATIPIVFALGDDPVKLGVVASFNRPGANITGISFATTDLDAKRVELLRELIPRGAKIFLLTNPRSPGSELEVREVQMAARSLREQIPVLSVRDEQDFESVFNTLVQEHAGALVLGSGAFFTGHRDRLTALAARHGIPAIYDSREYVVAGGLISYGASVTDAYRQVGAYVGRILKGARPMDLPVMLPTRTELVVNLKVAKTIGLNIPEIFLLRADEVIE
jgi:putative ABC transport system substrate-binding protein